MANDPHLPPRAIMNNDHTISPMTISRGDHARERLDELEDKGIKIGLAHHIFTDLSKTMVPGQFFPNARGRGSYDDVFTGPPIAPMPRAFGDVVHGIDASDPNLIHAVRHASRTTWCGATVSEDRKEGPIDRPRWCDRCTAELEATSRLGG